jgi:hypothetical protein
MTAENNEMIFNECKENNCQNSILSEGVLEFLQGTCLCVEDSKGNSERERLLLSLLFSLLLPSLQNQFLFAVVITILPSSLYSSPT